RRDRLQHRVHLPAAADRQHHPRRGRRGADAARRLPRHLHRPDAVPGVPERVSHLLMRPAGRLLMLAALGASVARAVPPPPGLFENPPAANVPSGSEGCISCHTVYDDRVRRTEPLEDSATMHRTGTVNLSCADCHGGHPEVLRPLDAEPGTPSYEDATRRAHVLPAQPDVWKTSANPVRSYTALNRESSDFVRFVN